ncbi:UPF0149 family protein [Gulbenkiania mobilis]|uniref:YecA family protein n=1 Tax=Gulbenkiania mobilis TaxID=397457 RepID=A0ABY2CUF7_GULMO|nr:uncharacterized protein EV669_1081 [Gulbenkiania mobilis]
MKYRPLSDADYTRLGQQLKHFETQGAMSLERLDGFFAALVAGPEPLRPQECLSFILGEAFDDEKAFSSMKALEQFVDLLSRHWMEIAQALTVEGSYAPWLDSDGSGEMSGVAWAEGFVQGMTLLNEDWALLFESETGQELLYPILLLGLEKEAVTEGLQGAEAPPVPRQELLGALGPSVEGIQRFFIAERRRLEAEAGEDLV